MKKYSKNMRKISIPNKLFNTSCFDFFFQNVEKKKPLRYVGDILIPIFLTKGNKYVRFFILSMEKLFKKGNRWLK
jgi:hypothetical protein